jgi:hypothetical protein
VTLGKEDKAFEERCLRHGKRDAVRNFTCSPKPSFDQEVTKHGFEY